MKLAAVKFSTRSGAHASQCENIATRNAPAAGYQETSLPSGYENRTCWYTRTASEEDVAGSSVGSDGTTK